MRSHSFQKTMLRLAMIAMLLLALLPTWVRLAGYRDAGMADVAGSKSMSSSLVGLKAMSSMHAMADGSMMTSDHAMPGHGDGVCAYCPLLASLTLLVFVLLVLPALRLPDWIPSQRTFALRFGRRHPCGLGSRGPPLQA